MHPYRVPHQAGGGMAGGACDDAAGGPWKGLSPPPGGGRMVWLRGAPPALMEAGP